MIEIVSFHVLPAGSMSTDGNWDWSGTEVTATVYEDGLWLVLDDEGSQWAAGQATSVVEAQAAVTSAVEAEIVPRCGYCGRGPCRSSARTANGRDVERFHRYHS